ncbi:MAG: hypothetical protein QGF36_05195 [Candidatus Marinimicrobia bacterium]|nr:hypothetical protein [Candidatus Neomarinimicrobiota bacterium]
MKLSLIPLIFSFSLFSQTVSDFAYTGARAGALAGAATSIKGNEMSIYHNPAAIAETEGNFISAGGGHLYGFTWLPTYQLSLLMQNPLFGKIAIGIQKLEAKYNGTSLSNETAISLASGIDLQHDRNSRLSVGGTVNYLTWELGKSAGVSGDGSDGIDGGELQAVSLDLGALASLRGKYRFGVFLKNASNSQIGNNLSAHSLPRRMNAGISYTPIPHLTTTIVSEQFLGRDDLQIKGGVSYQFKKGIELNIGAQSNPNRIGAGVSIDQEMGRQTIRMIYGLLSHPVLPLTHQYQIGITF